MVIQPACHLGDAGRRPVVFALAALLLFAAGASASAQAPASQVSGRNPKVLDSGLLDFAGKLVYLYGLRGVRPDRTCTQGAQVWACGREARWAVADRVANQWVNCVQRGRGPGGEIFAVCYLGGVGGPELNSWLVEQGWAVAARDYSQDYVAAEQRARAAGRGLWRGG